MSENHQGVSQIEIPSLYFYRFFFYQVHHMYILLRGKLFSLSISSEEIDVEGQRTRHSILVTDKCRATPLENIKAWDRNKEKIFRVTHKFIWNAFQKRCLKFVMKAR